MNKSIRTNARTPARLLILLFAVRCCALMPAAQAVSPPPDGGYPGENTAEGTSALLHLTGGTNNTAVGWASLGFDVTGNLNTAVGAGTLLFNTADQNTATGAGALLQNNTGAANTANGALALFSNTTGFANTAIGSGALSSNTIGNNNIALGSGAGSNLVDCDNNIDIGSPGVGYECDTIRIGTQGTQVLTIIAGIYGSTALEGTPVYIDSTGQLGTSTSSRQFKKDIQAMDKASEVILALNPVKFHYKTDSKLIPQYGLIAEEVAEVNPDLVVHDNDGQPYTVRYDAVNAMLLNEFLKEHKKVQEQQASIASLKSTVARERKNVRSKLAEQEKQIAALTAALQK